VAPVRLHRRSVPPQWGRPVTNISFTRQYASRGNVACLLALSLPALPPAAAAAEAVALAAPQRGRQLPRYSLCT